MSSMLRLNDRLYSVRDLGEGPCTVIMMYLGSTHHRLDTLILTEPNDQRFILVDFTPAWSKLPHDYTLSEMSDIARDMALLLDVYWLDQTLIDSFAMGYRFSEQLAPLLFKRYVHNTHQTSWIRELQSKITTID
ncbi:hypothetical protein [Agarivorans aestuarii]|uniref:hypothetical protein n=1 Tax=Agarivorans aestuarii TaxID=1563703 RepID=UPI001C7E890D|nr:hypothetical protein [Agarivorans aestuarii]